MATTLIPKIGAIGSLVQWNAAGTAIVHPGTGTNIDHLSIPGAIPSGMSWITDTINSFDIHKYIDHDPTIVFDPQATDSNGRGSFDKPYSTAAQLEAAINRLSKNNTVHIGGQVIGLKRGSILHGGLRLKMAGASGDPVFVVPYGDAEALPIITGAAVYANTGNPATGWSVTSDSRVYKINSTTEYDVFDTTYTPIYNQRYYKVVAGADEAATIAALIAAGPGTKSFLSGVIYIYPYDGEPDWTKVEVNSVAHNTDIRYALDVRYGNIAASGYITIAGIHCRSAASVPFYAQPLGSEYANITSIDQVKVVGCMLGNAGVDRASTGVDTGMQCGAIYGLSNALRVTDAYWAGNYSYDAMNNAAEFGHTTNLIHEFNKADYTTGPNIIELYRNNTGTITRYNIGKGKLNRPNVSNANYGHKGVWLSAYPDSGTIRTCAQSQNNVFHHNISLEIGDGIGFDITGDATLVYNNYIENVGTTGGGQINMTASGDATACSATIKNNILNQTAGGSGGRNISAAVGTVSTLSDNWYRRSNGTANVYVNGASYDGLTAIINGVDGVGADGPDPAALGAATTFTAGRAATGAAVLTAGVAIAGYTELDKDGVYSATPAIGPYYVGA